MKVSTTLIKRKISPAMSPTLIIFSGLSATGKTTLASELARQMGAVYLRIDSIEQAIRDSGAGDGSIKLWLRLQNSILRRAIGASGSARVGTSVETRR